RILVSDGAVARFCIDANWRRERAASGGMLQHDVAGSGLSLHVSHEEATLVIGNDEGVELPLGSRHGRMIVRHRRMVMLLSDRRRSAQRTYKKEESRNPRLVSHD